VQLGVTNEGNFSLDPASSHYSPAFGGVISKGLFLYHLELVQANPFDPFCGNNPNPAVFCQAWVLKSDASPTTRQLPIATTAAQNLWYESATMWEDRQTELRTRCGVSGGADLPVKARPAAPPPSVSACTSVWIKLLGSWTDREVAERVRFNNREFDLDLGYKQDSFGFLGGVTGGVASVFSPYDAISFSLMAGYLDSKVKFNQAGSSIKLSGGTAGFSGSYMIGGLFLDGLFKADFLELKFNTPEFGLAGLGGLPSTNALTIGGMGNVGYRFNLGRYFFVEPMGTIAYAKTTIDSLAVLNQLGADVRWDEGDSLRIAGGGRFGVNMPYQGTHRVEASVTMRAWHELLGDNNTVILAGLPDLVLNDNFKKSHIEVKGGLDVISNLPGWSGFVNAGVKFNDEQHTVTAKGGFNYRWDWR
jgi:hypothetical protein